MKCVRVMIADGDREYLRKNTERLKRMEGIEIVASTVSGGELIRAITSQQADVLITGLTLTGVDGLAVLEAMQGMKRKTPKTIVLTNMTSNSVVNAAVGLGASYYLIKPVDMTLVYNRIKLLTEDKTEDEAENTDDDGAKAGMILRRMGISPSMRGYGFLKESVTLRISDEEKYRHLTNELYPKIAGIYGISAVCVERAIRTAIASAWNKGMMQKFAAETEDALLLRGKPTAGQMIEKLCMLMRGSFSRLN